MAPTVAEREVEARRFLSMSKNIGRKIACTTENLALASQFASEGVTVGVTALYSAAQCHPVRQSLHALAGRWTRLGGKDARRAQWIHLSL
jgi:transaldolase